MVTQEDMVSKHYLGEQGKIWFRTGFGKFGETLKFGRVFQTRYFRPFCSKDLVLLDFGCADGLFLRILPAKRRIGVEVIHEALESCRKLCEETEIPIDLHESLETVADDSVDVVISNHCLEHVPSPIHVLGQIRRVLKSGGIFVIVVPFDDFRSKGSRRWRPGSRSNHLFTWTPMNLGNLVTEAGFEVKECSICTTAWSSKFYWIHDLFGLTAFKTACFLFSILRNRREVFCIAVNTKS